MNGRVWGLKLSLFIKTDCICGLTYKALPKLDLFQADNCSSLEFVLYQILH